MAEPEHNQLNNLFKRSGSGSIDDFEREALDGFNSLGSQQEAYDLQKKVEQRVEKELFGKKEKRKLFVYWYAAAGLMLVIGLSAYFILNKSDLNNKKNVAALEEIEHVSNAPAQSAIESSEYSEGQTKGKNQAGTKSQSERTADDLQDKGREANRYAGPVADEKAAGERPEGNDGDLYKKAEVKEPAAKAFEQKAEPAMADNLAMAQPEAAKEESIMQNQKNASHDLAQEAGGKKIMDANNGETQDDRELEKNNVAAGKMQSPSGEAAESKSKEKHTQDRKKAKSQAAPGRAESSDIALKETDKDMKRDDAKPSEKKDEAANGSFTASGASGNRAETAPAINRESQGYYDGGESALKKDLREKLKQNDVNKKFDATLFINDKKQVEKVSFTKSNLSKEQQGKIETVLKSLSKFNFSNGVLKNGLLEYKLSYRP